MNIVNWIYIHEKYWWDMTTSHCQVYFYSLKRVRNGIILSMQTFPTAYSNCWLKEIILTFNSAVSKYVMSNCWTVISTWIVYLSSAVFQFNCTHTGAEVPDNRTGVRVRPVWGRESDCWERELMPTSCYCFIVATFTIIAALDLWLINFHQCIAVLYCGESHELLRQTPDGGGKTGPFCENSKIVSTVIQLTFTLEPTVEILIYNPVTSSQLSLL